MYCFFTHNVIASNSSQCYEYLADAVRSSNYDFIYIEAENVNIVVDSDDGKKSVCS